MVKGTVHFFNEDKGWGFITPEGGGKDVFVHYKDIVGSGFKTLEAGEQVAFETEQTPRGPQARAVRRAGAFVNP